MSESPHQPSQPILPGEAGPRLMAAIGRVFARELPLAVRAARQLRSRTALILAVLSLASVAFFSSVFTRELIARQLDPEYRPRLSYDRAREGYSDRSFWQRWWHTYEWDRSEPLIFKPLRTFRSPLSPATGVANGWIGLLAASFFFPRREMGPWRAAPYTVLIAALRTVLHVLIFVALVGWIKDQNRRPAVADLRRYWRAYYGPALAVELIGLAAYSVLQMPIYIPSWQSWIFRTPLAYLMIRVLMRALAVAFMLAPYVVVARGVGAWNAIIEGLRLLGRRWFALVTLFVLYWVGYEVLNLWEALAPWPAYRTYLSLSIPAPVLWVWVSEIGLALLGLWVAYALVEIAKGVRMVSAQCGNGAQAPSPVC